MIIGCPAYIWGYDGFEHHNIHHGAYCVQVILYIPQEYFPSLYRELLYTNIQDFLDIQLSTSFIYSIAVSIIHFVDQNVKTC